MRTFEIAEDVLEAGLASSSVRDWARLVMEEEESNSTDAWRRLRALTSTSADIPSATLHALAGAMLVRWGDGADTSISLDAVSAELFSLGSECFGEPVLGAWLAGAAVGMAEEMSVGWAAEMHTLAWRLGLSCPPASTRNENSYLELLIETEYTPMGVVLSAHLAPIRLALCAHLKEICRPNVADLLSIVEANSFASLAMAAAAEKRTQATEHYVDCLEAALSPAALRWKGGASTDEDIGLLESINIMWIDDYLSNPASCGADALLAVDNTERALELWGTAIAFHGRQDMADKELALVRGIVRRVEEALG